MSLWVATPQHQGLRACDGYQYEFHIGKGKSLNDKMVYRIEFTNRLPLSPPPTASSPVGGGNELLWQLTGGTETMKVTRLISPYVEPRSDDGQTLFPTLHQEEFFSNDSGGLLFSGALW